MKKVFLHFVSPSTPNNWVVSIFKSLCENAVSISLWLLSSIICATILSHLFCNVLLVQKSDDCPMDFPWVPLPSIDDKNLVKMKQNVPIYIQMQHAIHNGQFDHSQQWKSRWNHSDNHITSIVYNNNFNARIGEVAIPMAALYHENAINDLIIVDDSLEYKSTMLWQKEMLFGDEMDTLFDNDVLSKWGMTTNHDMLQFSSSDTPNSDSNSNLKPHRNTNKKYKNIVQTNNIGKWNSFEIGSRLARHSSKLKKQAKTQTEENLDEKQKVNSDLILLLDTLHALPDDDKWIMQAMALFDKFENLQILGGFTGITKHGQTWGDVTRGSNRRNRRAHKEKHFFSFQDRASRTGINTRKRKTSASNTTAGGEGYYSYNNNGNYAQDMVIDLRQMYFDMINNDMNEKDKLLKKIDPRLQRLELSEHDKDTLDGYYNHDALSIFIKNGKIEEKLKQHWQPWLDEMKDKREEQKQRLIETRNLDLDKIGDNHQGLENADLSGLKPMINVIPYETEVKLMKIKIEHTTNKSQQGIDESEWIPFMFVTSVRMAPIFVRHDWWFDVLLPHLQNKNVNMEFNMGIEMSLHTLSLGGNVGLYSPKGFKYDRKHLDQEINRWHDYAFEHYQEMHMHMLSQNHQWNVWNVSYLVNMNEKVHANHLRKRNDINEYLIQYSHNLLKDEYESEQVLDPNVVEQNYGHDFLI